MKAVSRLTATVLFAFLKYTSCVVIKISKYEKVRLCPALNSEVEGCMTSAESSTTVLSCARKCSTDDLCVGFSRAQGGQSCFIHHDCASPSTCSTGNLTGFVYFKRMAVPEDCASKQAHYNSVTMMCQCIGGWVGRRCERPAAGCIETSRWGYRSTRLRQLRIVQPFGASEPYYIYCRLTNLQALSLVLMYDSRSTLFEGKLWDDYVSGIYALDSGSIKSLFIGLERTASLWNILKPPAQLNIVIRAQRINKHFYYNGATIGNASTNYALSYSSRSITNFSPTSSSWDHCVDAQIPGIGPIPFSTPDADNDLDPGRHCASLAGAGWWFTSCSPDFLCNPLGVLYDSSSDPGGPSLCGLRAPRTSGNPGFTTYDTAERFSFLLDC